MTTTTGGLRVSDVGVAADVIGTTSAGEDPTEVDVKVEGTSAVVEGNGNELVGAATVVEGSCTNCRI